jgi:sulfate transport system permease protein
LAARAEALSLPVLRRARPGGLLGAGTATLYLSVVVLLPLAALTWSSAGQGRHAFREAVTSPEAVAALKLTLAVSALVALLQAVAGTAVAWVLVRDRFRGQRLVDALIDLPFALPTIVAGLTLLAVYGPRKPLGVDLAFSRLGIGAAFLFVTLPFVVRTVQPVLLELDREAEDAAASLGAARLVVFRRIVLPAILPAILSGVALAFARAIGEFGAVILISGNQPFRTEVMSFYVFGRIESGDAAGAAAVSVVLLCLTLAVLLAIGGLRRWATRHDG